MILPRTLKGAARPNPDDKGSDSEPEVELVPISTVPEVSALFGDFIPPSHVAKYRDPLYILLEYIAEVSTAEFSPCT